MSIAGVYERKDEQQTLVIVTGPVGVGKTTVCNELFRMICGCAWLDADWCWMVNPWHAKSDGQKGAVERSFGHLLDTYLDDDATDVVIFSWHIYTRSMFDLVTDQISHQNYKLVKIALVCERYEHVERMSRDRRRNEQLETVDDMEKYYSLGAYVLDTTDLSPREVAQKMLERVV